MRGAVGEGGLGWLWEGFTSHLRSLDGKRGRSLKQGCDLDFHAGRSPLASME